MNYTTDDDFDFYSELNSTTEEEIADEKKCMISHLPLTYNSIVLPCKHTFNYMPLYNELVQTNLKDYKIHCPYCRAVTFKLIPYIPLPDVKKIIGVNYPSKACMDSPSCSFIMKQGANKGLPCNNNGMESADGVFCEKHIKKDTPMEEEKEKEKEQAQAQLLKTKSVIELRAMLRARGLKVGGLKQELINRLL